MYQRQPFLVLIGFSINVLAEFNWPSHGLTELNSRNVNDVDKKNPIDSSNVAKLTSAWNFTTGTTANSGTPAIKGSGVYHCSFDGNLYAIKKKTGALLWKAKISDITGVTGDYCRSTPALDGDTLVVGTQKSGYLFALRISTGTLLWKTKPNPHPLAVWTMGGTIFEDHVYIGASSMEEAASANPSYPCCSFRGSFHKIKLQTGEVVWTFWAIDLALPVGPGQYSGNGVWGSSPAVDKKRSAVFIGTGNPYDLPASVQTCANNAQATNTDPSPCIDSRVYFNSIVSLNMDTGAINWVTRRTNYDAWVYACTLGGPSCPATAGPDADFGMAPILVRRGPHKKDVLLAGQKSGVAWSIDPDTGAVNWGVQTGPSGTLGGSNWGSASDGERYYVGNVNSNQLPYLQGPPASVEHHGGGWTALNVDTGAFVWQQADPAALSSDPSLRAGSAGVGPGTLVNDVLFVGSTAKDGELYAIHKLTGEILWRWATGGSIYGGASVSGGCVYVGSGYVPFRPVWATNDKILAFCLPGHMGSDDD